MTLPLQVHTRSGLTAHKAKPITFQLHLYTYHNNLHAKRWVEDNNILRTIKSIYVHKQVLTTWAQAICRLWLESK